MHEPADDVPSPCVRVCLMHPGSGYCLGCFRTLNEIAAWSQLSASEKRRLLAQLPQRQQWVASHISNAKK